MKRTNDNNGAMIASNDNWKTNRQTRIEAINIPLTDDSESAIVADLVRADNLAGVAVGAGRGRV
jgi:hypothetical protein